MLWTGVMWLWSGWTTNTSTDFSYIIAFAAICAEEKYCAAVSPFAEVLFFFWQKNSHASLS